MPARSKLVLNVDWSYRDFASELPEDRPILGRVRVRNTGDRTLEGAVFGFDSDPPGQIEFFPGPSTEVVGDHVEHVHVFMVSRPLHPGFGLVLGGDAASPLASARAAP